MTRFKAVIFDLDGTLLDSIADLADSMNNVMQKMGLPVYGIEEYKLMVGYGIRDLVLRVLPGEVRDEATIERCIVMLREEYGRRWALKTRPYEGVIELLEKLAANGMKMSILSNKLDTLTKLAVSRFFPDSRFACVMGASPGKPCKPDPYGALLIARNLQIAACRFLFLGDSDADMKAAAAAGMFSVGALWGFRGENELRNSGARALIRHPLDLLELLKRIPPDEL